VKTRGFFFYLALHLVLKEREYSVMEEGEVSKPYNIPRRFENKLNISLHTGAYCWRCLPNH